MRPSWDDASSSPRSNPRAPPAVNHLVVTLIADAQHTVIAGGMDEDIEQQKRAKLHGTYEAEKIKTLEADKKDGPPMRRAGCGRRVKQAYHKTLVVTVKMDLEGLQGGADLSRAFEI